MQFRGKESEQPATVHREKHCLLASLVHRVLNPRAIENMSLPAPQPNGHGVDPRPLVFAVDDEPMLLELVAMVLEPLGCRVQTFRDPAAAVRAFALAQPRPALIITDFAMHAMNGLDLIRDCRRLQPQQKVLMVSGTVDEAIYYDSPYKPNQFLAKPYPAATLAEMVLALLAK